MAALIILITNDDGVNSEGIRILADVAADFGEVWVVAPSDEMSAASHSLSVRRSVSVKKVGNNFYSVEGSPADSVLIALFGIMPKWPDLVLSGINAGFNLAEDVFYSGTVSAAREGALYGIPSIAFSLENSNPMFWDTAEKVSREVLSEFSSKRDFKLLSVNIPAAPYGHIRGKVWTYLGNRIYNKPVKRNGDGTFAIGGKPEFIVREGSDVWAVLNLYVSITPLSLDLTDWKVLRGRTSRLTSRGTDL